ncbi:stage V sporulation protein E [Clostridium grantii]|uniref:Probable peptidoglycan glycosyltransferase FtsW n=1 Tax=Clostridium grantii DSM 8605 TaxID=1121316 RepID=A0A1M5SHQ0_9CLOT|nr:stage V sporulation protein E [Clostridium grantii]SHH38019.1 cell division protein FtsW [Clostridium grantii DSM 8605]
MSKSLLRKQQVDFILLSCIMSLVAIGVIMVYSASSHIALYKYKNDLYFLKRQGAFAFLGFTSMFFISRIDYHWFRHHTGKIMIIVVAFLLLVLLPIFPSINGARRWIIIGPVSIQPSEMAKYVVVLYMAKSITNKGNQIKSFLYGVLPYLLVSGFFAGLVLAEKNLSIAAVIMIVTIIVLFAAGCKFIHICLVGGFVGALGVAATVFQPYRMQRFLTFLDPWADPKGAGYQLIQSLLALGSGSILGQGLGLSRQKCYYIPEPHNDFIFSVIGEELGLVGCTFIMILFIIFIARGISVALNAKDLYGTILAVGITAVIAVQAIINIAVVTGSMPVTGVPLPFISYGGSSLFINLSAMGLLLNVSKQVKNKRSF